MKRSLVAAAIVAGLAACAQLHLPGMGWETLIDGGKGLENFDRVGDANWRVEDGAVVADRGKSGHLVTKKSYGDFEIRAEFWAASDTNSGVFIRCNNREKIDSKNCYEVNIWDTRPDPKFGSGAIVDVAAVPVPLTNRVGGKWNTYEIVAKGGRMTVRLNGVQTVDVDEQKMNLRSGPFTLQYALGGAQGAQGGPIKWRKVEVRPL
jgi:3-keto-disaccharide hydrolase